MKHKIYIVGMGPGREDKMTEEAKAALQASDTIIGYQVYLDLLLEKGKAEQSDFCKSLRNKEFLSTPMRREEERCRMCFEETLKNKTVSIVCSGDAGIYGMASLMYEIGREFPEVELLVIPGITAAISGAALLGAPLNHDFCVISLSDLLTPWDKIEKRLRLAAEADFAIAIYNPSSHKRRDYLQKACDILLQVIEPERPCGYVENIGRDGESTKVCTLGELRDCQVNMFTTVFIGNATTEMVGNQLVTKRGYRLAEQN
jgi:precorrin-3B C17-methyltransferase